MRDHDTDDPVTPADAWEQVVPAVVDGWLFPPDVALPPSLVIPLENPHLHDAARWRSVFGAPLAECGVIDLHRTANGDRVGVAKPVMGAPAVALLVDAATRRGVDWIVGVGFCGGTSKHLHSGDLIVTTAALCRDGVSAAYLSAADVPDSDEAPASRELLALVPRDTRCGRVCSVAAVHLEDQRLIDECEARGVLGVDLETATVLAVAAVRQVQALTCLVVSDVPARGEPADVEALPAAEARALTLALSLATARPGR
jgi:uridine phosphorylase